MDWFADRPIFDHLANCRIVIVGHILRADLNEATILLGRRVDLLRQLELIPVRQRFLAVDVLLRVQGVDRLRRVMRVGRGDAHDIDVRVVEQLLVLVIHLCAAEPLARRFQPRPINVAYGDRLGHPLLLKALNNALMGTASAADADEADADPLVGPFGRFGHQLRHRKSRRGNRSGPDRSLEE